MEPKPQIVDAISNRKNPFLERMGESALPYRYAPAEKMGNMGGYIPSAYYNPRNNEMVFNADMIQPNGKNTSINEEENDYSIPTFAGESSAEKALFRPEEYDRRGLAIQDNRETGLELNGYVEQYYPKPDNEDAMLGAHEFSHKMDNVGGYRKNITPIVNSLVREGLRHKARNSKTPIIQNTEYPLLTKNIDLYGQEGYGNNPEEAMARVFQVNTDFQPKGNYNPMEGLPEGYVPKSEEEAMELARRASLYGVQQGMRK